MKMSSLFASLLPLALCLALLGHSGVDARGARGAHAAPFVIPANASTADLVAAVCGTLNRKDLCLSSLQSVPDVGSAPDVGVLAITALKVATSNASDTSAVIQGLLNDTTLAPTVQQALSDCADHYLDAVEQLDDSVAALTARAYTDVRKWVKIAIADADGCEAGFQQLATGPNILSHRNLIFRQLCNNALGIVKLLKA
ncbi:pectinesterase inhibitor-like [Rhodamnia argentea]|uniref:Pectinesterase inhibitor-like n=1 Tax=Rhodamnia argentea TaxID=178133 RepID=A0A8B8QAL0_9MYRT|nr:pectinesterase inhibitor-like [Rhodamnia argentea]